MALKDSEGEKIVYVKEDKEAKADTIYINTIKEPDFVGQYTQTDAGQKRFGGWTPTGLRRFVQLKNLCEQSRKKTTTEAIEEKISQQLRKKFGITENSWKEHKKAGKGYTDAEPAEEIEDLFDVKDLGFEVDDEADRVEENVVQYPV